MTSTCQISGSVEAAIVAENLRADRHGPPGKQFNLLRSEAASSSAREASDLAVEKDNRDTQRLVVVELNAAVAQAGDRAGMAVMTPTPSLDLPSAATAPRCSRRARAVSAWSQNLRAKDHRRAVRRSLRRRNRGRNAGRSGCRKCRTATERMDPFQLTWPAGWTYGGMKASEGSPYATIRLWRFDGVASCCSSSWFQRAKRVAGRPAGGTGNRQKKFGVPTQLKTCYLCDSGCRLEKPSCIFIHFVCIFMQARPPPASRAFRFDG